MTNTVRILPTANLTAVQNNDNLIAFPVPKIEKQGQTNSQFKTNGVKKATPADPIHNIEDVHRIQNYFLSRNEYRNYVIFTLGVSFTLRAGDLLSLKFGDVFNQDGSVKDSFTLYEDKTNKRNKININAKCKEALEEYLERTYYDLGRDPEIEEPLFYSKTSKSSEDGLKAISISMLDRVLRRAGKDLELEEHLSSHSMRKTLVYHTIKNSNYDPSTIYLLQRMLNHSDQRITFRYCGIEDESIAAIRDAFGDLLI